MIESVDIAEFHLSGMEEMRTSGPRCLGEEKRSPVHGTAGRDEDIRYSGLQHVGRKGQRDRSGRLAWSDDGGSRRLCSEREPEEGSRCALYLGVEFPLANERLDSVCVH